MEISVVDQQLAIPVIAMLISFVVLGVGIYILYLLIKALRVYIKNNS